MNRLKSLFYYIMQNPILFLIGLLFPPIVNLIIDVLAAYSTEIFINFSNDDNLGFSYIYSSMFLFILILIILTIVEDVARFIFDLFKKKTENNMKTDILSSIVKSKYKTFLAYGKGFIFNVYDGDTKSTVNVISTDIFSIIYPIVMGIGYLVIIFTKNIFIGSLLFILCSIVILLNIFLTKKRVELQKKAKNINDDLISKMEELLQNKNNIRALAVTLPINKKMDKLSNKYLDVDRQNRFFSFLKISCIDTIIKICSILIAPFSCVLVSWGILPIASVALIIQLSRSFIPICSGIGSAFNNLKMDTVSVNRFMNIKDLQTEDYSVKTESINNTKNLLIVNKAHALLNTNKKLVDISFNMEYGEIVAIVGPSGCGKSSFAKALMKILDYYGEIKLNGTDISELGISFVRDQISYVPEFNNIFEGTIRENLLWAKQDSTEDELFKVIKAVALDCGLIDKNVGPRGEKLSGGQRQKIAIARALLKDSKLIILDEPTSALDNDSEASVLECISSIARTGKGIIIITHKESTASIANKIIRLI